MARDSPVSSSGGYAALQPLLCSSLARGHQPQQRGEFGQAQRATYNADRHQLGIVLHHQWQVNVPLLAKLISADVVAALLRAGVAIYVLGHPGVHARIDGC